MSEFSILNESSLHNTLKIYYAAKTNGKMEVELYGHIYDVYSDNNFAIEIQTKNLSKLHDKIKDSLEKGLKIKVVYPLIVKNTIFLNDENGNLISKRKSPKKGNIYDIFKEITGLYDILLDENFSLEVVYVTMIEHRVKTSKPVQSKNNNRRFKKDWLKVNKCLEEIISIQNLKNKDDYLSLLPKDLPEEFCAKDIKNCFIKNKNIPSRIYNNTNIITWQFLRMNLIKETQTKSRSRFYRINK